MNQISRRQRDTAVDDMGPINPPYVDPTASAQRIRDLVSAARTCIIEIGRELIAVKAQAAHGAWLPWLEREFGWSRPTGDRYIAVAYAFQNAQAEQFETLTIDATALYALAAPDVPQQVRDEAIAQAQSGEHITKAEADRMIAEATTAAVKKAIEKEREDIAADIEELEAEANELQQKIEDLEAAPRPDTKDADAAVLAATTTLNELRGAYDTTVAELVLAKRELSAPSDETLIRLITKLTKKRPSRIMLTSLASVVGRPITHDDKTYAPVDEQKIVEMREAEAQADEKLSKLFDPKGPAARWHRALMALRAVNDLDPVETLFAVRYDAFDHAFQTELPKSLDWVNAFAKGMNNVAARKSTESAGGGGSDQTAAQKGRARRVSNG